MNIKKEVYNRIAQILKDELNKARYKLLENKCAMKRLAEEQTILKRECAKLDEMNRTILKNGTEGVKP